MAMLFRLVLVLGLVWAGIAYAAWSWDNRSANCGAFADICERPVVPQTVNRAHKTDRLKTAPVKDVVPVYRGPHFFFQSVVV